MWEGAALSQSHSFGTEGWWDLSFNVRRQRQRPRQAWLRAGCRHLSPPTLSESSYTYLLRSTALRVLTRQSPKTPCRGRAGRETSLEGRRALGRALTSPTPLFYSGSSRLTQNQWWLQQLLFSRSPKPPGTRAWGHTAIGTLCLQGPPLERGLCRGVGSPIFLFTSSLPLQSPPWFGRTVLSSSVLSRQLLPILCRWTRAQVCVPAQPVSSITLFHKTNILGSPRMLSVDLTGSPASLMHPEDPLLFCPAHTPALPARL